MKSSISGIQTFHYGQELVFDAYIQYKEYIGFVKVNNRLSEMLLRPAAQTSTSIFPRP